MVEIVVCHPREVVISKIDILRSQEALTELRRLDGEPFKCAGFVVLPNLGFVLQGFHSPIAENRVLTVFARGRWEYLRRRFILSRWSRSLWKTMLDSSNPAASGDREV